VSKKFGKLQNVLMTNLRTLESVLSTWQLIGVGKEVEMNKQLPFGRKMKKAVEEENEIPPLVMAKVRGTMWKKLGKALSAEFEPIHKSMKASLEVYDKGARTESDHKGMIGLVTRGLTSLESFLETLAAMGRAAEAEKNKALSDGMNEDHMDSYPFTEALYHAAYWNAGRTSVEGRLKAFKGAKAEILSMAEKLNEEKDDQKTFASHMVKMTQNLDAVKYDIEGLETMGEYKVKEATEAIEAEFKKEVKWSPKKN